jgi:hypothetical protein
MELNESSFEVPSRRQRSGRRYGARASAARRGRRPFAPRTLRPTVILIGLAFAVAVYGVAASRDLVAVVGLAAVAFAMVAMARGARTSIRALMRRCEVHGRARAESERARHDLEVENAELERRYADLRARHAAIVEGFDALDERTGGRLYDLIEQAGDELGELTEEALDDPWEEK